MGMARHIMVTLWSKTFLFIELKAFDASTSRTASQVWSSYITSIGCMVESQPARPKLCGNCVFPQNFHTRKLGKITVFLQWNLQSSYWRDYFCSYVWYNYFTSYTTQHVAYTWIFVEWNIRQVRKASKDVDWFLTLQIFLMTWANALHRTLCKSFTQTGLMLKSVFNYLRPYLKVLNHLTSLLQHFVSFLRQYLHI